MEYFVLDGKPSRDFGIGISGTGSWGTPQREIEKVKIPGRSGYLITYVGGWENVEVEYPAWIARGFRKKWNKFSEWWNAHTDNYYELHDTYHPEYFRLACPVSKLDPDVGTLNLSGKISLKFDCKPQKFLKDGIVPRVIKTGESLTLRNPTDYDAYPLMVASITEDADSDVMICDDTDSIIARIQFKTEDDAYNYGGAEIEYDSETQEAVTTLGIQKVYANSAVVENFENGFKKLYIPARTEVSIQSWHGKFKIYPRWYRI